MFSKRLIVPVLAAVSLVLSGASANANVEDYKKSNLRLAAVRKLLVPWDRPGGPGAAVAVTMDGRLVASVAVGTADLEHVAPIQGTTSFHSASLSKQFTAFAILLLEQDGKLSIDAPLSDYLGEARIWPAMSLRQLMNHTSGLRDQWTLLGAAGWRPEDLVTDGQVMQLLFDQRGSNFAPASAYQYNNSGYSLLAEVVRRVSGKSLRQYCDERIFQPLGMTGTHFQDNIKDVVPRRALSYTKSSGRDVRVPLNYATAGPTGLQTTTEDLSKWAINFESPRVGGPALIARMQVQGVLTDGTVNAYALGQERRPYKGFDTWSHGGRDAGYRSFLLRIPAERFSIAVLGNSADVDTAKIAFAVADIYLASRPAFRAPPPAIRSTPTAAMLDAYAGDYELFPGLIFTLSTNGQALYFASLGSSEKTALPSLSATAFQLNARDDLAIEFAPNVDGQATGFQYRIGLHGALPAKRITLLPFTPESTQLDGFSGRYYSRELRAEYELSVEGGRLVARHARREPISLRPYQKDTFASAEWNFQKLQFQSDTDGKVTGFRLSGAAAENILFTRQPDQ